MYNYTKLIIKTTASFIIVMVLLIAGAFMFREWIFSQQYLQENAFLKAAGEGYQNMMTYFIGDNPPRNIAINYIFPFVLFFMSVSILSIISLVFLLISRRIYKSIALKRRMKKVDVIQDLILDYLYEPDTITFETLRGEKKKLVIGEMVHLYGFIIGEKAEMLKKLFKDLRLDRYVAKKINSIFWDNKLRYINVATAMDLANLIFIIKKYVNSTNWHVRDAAQLSLLRLDKKYSFDFLNKVHRKISEWQETQMYHLIVKESIPVDDFSKYLLSDNDSVAILALKLMEDFEQRNHSEKIIKLLNHKNYHVKKQALKAIIGLNIKEAERTIINYYPNEKTSIQILSIEALAKFNTPNALAFIKHQLPSNNFDINKAAIKYLSNNAREEVLSQIKWNSDIEQIVKHVNNKQLV